MSSTINGNAGVAAYNASASMSLIPVDTRGAATGVPVQAAVILDGRVSVLGRGERLLQADHYPTSADRSPVAEQPVLRRLKHIRHLK